MNSEDVFNDEVKSKLANLANRRYYNLIRRCERLGMEPPLKDIITNIIFDCYKNGFACFYCGKQLKFKSPKPYKSALSIDHYVPLSMGGESNKENIVICCFECNIIKGTMAGDVYKKFLASLDAETKQKVFAESFNGKFADKRDRNHSEIKKHKKGYTQSKLFFD